MLNMTLWLCRY